MKRRSTICQGFPIFISSQRHVLVSMDGSFHMAIGSCGVFGEQKAGRFIYHRNGGLSMAMSVYWSVHTCTNGKEKKTVPIGIAEPACFSVMKFHRVLVSDLHPIGVHSSKLNSSPLKMVVFNRIFLSIRGNAPIFRGENITPRKTDMSPEMVGRCISF